MRFARPLRRARGSARALLGLRLGRREQRPLKRSLALPEALRAAPREGLVRSTEGPRTPTEPSPSRKSAETVFCTFAGARGY